MKKKREREDRGKEVASGLLKVLKDGRGKRRRKQAQREWSQLVGSIRASPLDPTRRDEGVEGGGTGRRRIAGAAVGSSHCDQRTNRWYIVFPLAYHNLRQYHNVLIYCASVCTRATERWRRCDKLCHWEGFAERFLPAHRTLRQPAYLLSPPCQFCLHVGWTWMSIKPNQAKQSVPLPGSFSTQGSVDISALPLYWTLVISVVFFSCIVFF